MLAVAAVGLAAHVAQAAPISVGSQGFADISAPSVDTGNINTGTAFTIGNFITTASQSGYFAGLATQLFGPVLFNSQVGTSFSFGNPTFGSFTSTAITPQDNTLGLRSFLIVGNYTAGTFDPTLEPNPAPASLQLSFTQSPPATGAISASATFAIPPVVVPEPSTLMLAYLGIVGGIAADQGRRRQHRRPAAASGRRGPDATRHFG